MIKIEHATIQTLSWRNGMQNRNEVNYILDLISGLKYPIIGEHNNKRHTDYVCATPEATKIKLKTANGNFNNNWTARPCILIIGDRYFAAATHNAAHPNDMRNLRNPNDIGHNGHFCVWVRDAITGQVGQRLSAEQISYQNRMRAAVEEAKRITDAMSQKELEQLIYGTIDEVSEVKRFNALEKMPSWAKPTIEKLINRGFLQGNGQNLDLSEDMLRIFVINDRAGLYGK